MWRRPTQPSKQTLCFWDPDGFVPHIAMRPLGGVEPKTRSAAHAKSRGILVGKAKLFRVPLFFCRARGLLPSPRRAHPPPRLAARRAAADARGYTQGALSGTQMSGSAAGSASRLAAARARALADTCRRSSQGARSRNLCWELRLLLGGRDARCARGRAGAGAGDGARTPAQQVHRRVRRPPCSRDPSWGANGWSGSSSSSSKRRRRRRRGACSERDGGDRGADRAAELQPGLRRLLEGGRPP